MQIGCFAPFSGVFPSVVCLSSLGGSRSLMKRRGRDVRWVVGRNKEVADKYKYSLEKDRKKRKKQKNPKIPHEEREK